MANMRLALIVATCLGISSSLNAATTTTTTTEVIQTPATTTQVVTPSTTQVVTPATTTTQVVTPVTTTTSRPMVITTVPAPKETVVIPSGYVNCFTIKAGWYQEEWVSDHQVCQYSNAPEGSVWIEGYWSCREYSSLESKCTKWDWKAAHWEKTFTVY